LIITKTSGTQGKNRTTSPGDPEVKFRILGTRWDQSPTDFHRFWAPEPM